MNELYNDLLAILDYADEQKATSGDEILPEVTSNNIAYIRGVVQGAKGAIQ